MLAPIAIVTNRVGDREAGAQAQERRKRRKPLSIPKSPRTQEPVSLSLDNRGDHLDLKA